jgi:hypothetical protein
MKHVGLFVSTSKYAMQPQTILMGREGMFEHAWRSMERLRIVSVAQKLNDTAANARDRQMSNGFAEPDWQDSPQLALICNALIWLIVALPFVLALIAVIRKLAAV